MMMIMMTLVVRHTPKCAWPLCECTVEVITERAKEVWLRLRLVRRKMEYWYSRDTRIYRDLTDEEADIKTEIAVWGMEEVIEAHPEWTKEDTNFKASWAAQKAWANSGLWPCGRIGRVPSDGKPDYGLVDGDEVWAVYESNGDLVDASWGGDDTWDVSADEWAAFQEWAICEYDDDDRSCGIHIK